MVYLRVLSNSELSASKGPRLLKDAKKVPLCSFEEGRGYGEGERRARVPMVSVTAPSLVIVAVEYFRPPSNSSSSASSASNALYPRYDLNKLAPQCLDETSLSPGLGTPRCFSAFSVSVLYFRLLSNSPSSASNALRPRNDLKKLPYLNGELKGVMSLGELPGTSRAGYCNSVCDRECGSGMATACVVLVDADDEMGDRCWSGAGDLASMARRLCMLSMSDT
jgi:hypothetical protein